MGKCGASGNRFGVMVKNIELFVTSSAMKMAQKSQQ
jgi:hypothetical protein